MRNMLHEMKVIDFTTNVAGPTCTGLLADYGATVIKVEQPKGGDDNRNFPPIIDGQGIIHCWCNRGKKSITLDIKDPEGINIAKKLIENADVVVESYRPGIMAKFGMDYEALKKIKSDIIYCSISAYGLTGPYSNRPGYDLIAQGVSGMMDLNGDPEGPPYKSGVTVGDNWAGLNAYGAIVTAWYHRIKTGEGQQIDAPLIQNLVWHNPTVLDYNTGVYGTRTGNDHPEFSPYGVFNGREDQYAVICITENKMWDDLCELMGRNELKSMDNALRLKERKFVTHCIEEWLKNFDDIKIPLERIEKAGIPCCKVFSTREVWYDQQFNDEKWLIEVKMPDDITSMPIWKTRNVPASFSKTPGSVGQSPVLGQNNHEILGAIMQIEEIDTIQARWLGSK